MDDLVTALREDRGGYWVTVNDTHTFRLSKTEYRELPLAEGQELDFEQYQHDLLLVQYPISLNYAVKMLALRPRSRREVERNLQARGCLPDTVEMVLYKLDKEKLLDDEAFAHSWARARSTLGMGKSRILMELRQKGVDNLVAQSAVDELNQEEADAQTATLAQKLLRRYRSLPEAQALRKSLAAMQRRGYSYGEASRALQTAIEQITQEL